MKEKVVTLGSSEDHLLGMGKSLRTLRDYEKLTDLRFLCWDKRLGKLESSFNAHRSLFSSRSAFLESLFRTNLERGDSEAVVIVLPEVEATTVKALLDYFYGGSVDSDLKEDLISLCQVLGIEDVFLEESSVTDKDAESVPTSDGQCLDSSVENEGSVNAGDTDEDMCVDNEKENSRSLESSEKRRRGIGPKSAKKKVIGPSTALKKRSNFKRQRSGAVSNEEYDSEEKASKKSKSNSNIAEDDIFSTTDILYCSLCSSIFVSTKALEKHMKVDHSDATDTLENVADESLLFSTDDEDRIPSKLILKKTPEKIKEERQSASEKRQTSKNDDKISPEENVNGLSDYEKEKVPKKKAHKIGPASKTNRSSLISSKKTDSSPAKISLKSTENDTNKSSKGIQESEGFMISLSSTTPSSKKPKPESKKASGSKKSSSHENKESGKINKNEHSEKMESSRDKSEKKASKSSSPSKVDSSSTPSSEKKRKSLGGDVKGSRSCGYCSEVFDKTANLKNHVLNHFKSDLCLEIPQSKPFICPTCTAVSRDKITLLRHYAFSHRNIYRFCSDEDLHGIPVEGQGSNLTKSESKIRESTKNDNKMSSSKEKIKMTVSSKLFKKIKSSNSCYGDSTDDDVPKDSSESMPNKETLTKIVDKDAKSDIDETVRDDDELSTEINDDDREMLAEENDETIDDNEPATELNEDNASDIESSTKKQEPIQFTDSDSEDTSKKPPVNYNFDDLLKE